MEGNTSNRRHHQLFRRRRCNEFYSQISNSGQIPISEGEPKVDKSCFLVASFRETQFGRRENVEMRNTFNVSGGYLAGTRTSQTPVG